MPKSNFKKLLKEAAGDKPVGVNVELAVTNLRMLGASRTGDEGAASDGAASSPFTGMFTPDKWKAYIEFDLYHSLPQIIGPTMQGSYVGYHPAVLAKSHKSLLHQQINLRHLIKAYDPKNIARDRIIGCVVATCFPKAPMQGWQIPASEADAPCIHACAVVFKMAEGVADLIGKHQTNRQPQSVSGETWCPIDDIGIYRPSTREIWTQEDAPMEFLSLMSIKNGKLRIGSYQGEQLVLAYGCADRQVDLRGVGVTPTPAEETAEITSVHAERELDETFAIAAEQIDAALLFGQMVSWDGTRFCGRVKQVSTAGMVSLASGFKLEARPEDPILEIETLSGRRVLKRISQISLN